MKLSKQEFLNAPRKAITFIGMSGAGKTHISSQLEQAGWNNYSCDFVIGDEYLRTELEGSFSADDIGALSLYLGRLGGEQHGGFALEKFKKRQKAYYDAEVLALNAMNDVMAQGNGHFVHDSTGSLCEIEEDDVIQKIGETTLFVYLKADAETEKEVLQRAFDYPKPLFFPAQFLSDHIEQFLSEQEIKSVDDIVPDDFSRWVFPKLFEARKPKYQRLADLYGVTIPAAEFYALQSSDQFIETIANHLDNA